MVRSPSDAPHRAALLGWRRWVFRLAATTLVPLAVLMAVELGLRVMGSGHPAGFFVPVAQQAAETTNYRFGWRFFPPAIARSPVVTRLPRPKPADTYRIFVLGGSAAMGTPEPAFSFGRVLEILLEERYPGTDFEVVNTAMAAINSHVVLEIARDCARHQPDLFAVYLGNNEVVGPYGPGTVFAPSSARLPAIRLGLRLRQLRVGQLLAGGLATLRRQPAAPTRWRGMEMFQDRQVAADDPRLEQTYAQLEDNLTRIAAVAARADTPLLLSTVAVDLLDTPPFASLHRQGLGDDELARWQAAIDNSRELAAAGQVQEALGALAAALAIDDHHAGLHYRFGRLQLVAGDEEQGRRHLSRARDLDALRFRADTRVNESIRRVAANATGVVRLVEADRRLAEAPESLSGLPGRALFWEHVHLRFLGNYRLAEAFLEPLEPLLPEKVRARAGTETVAPPVRVAELLALTVRDHWQMTAAIHEMTRRPPFTGQLGHSPRQLASKRALLTLRSQAVAVARDTVEIYRRALQRRPDDLHLLELLARALDDYGTAAEAVEAWRQLVGRLPGIARWHTQLGFALAAAGEDGAAAAELHRALEILPESADPQINLATVLEQQGELDSAEELYRKALAIEPVSEVARANLAILLDRRGHREEAERLLHELLELDPSSATAHRRLGELQDRHGEREAAIASYRRALQLDHELAPVHNNLGYLLSESGQFDEAAQEYLRAIDDDPGHALAYFNLGDLLLSLGRATQAMEVYRAGLALEPSNDQARANLEQAQRLAAAN